MESDFRRSYLGRATRNISQNPDGLAFGPASEFINAVASRPADAFFTTVIKENPNWDCAALKILSRAAGHKFIALTEKWVGSEIPEKKKADFPGWTRYPKFMARPRLFYFRSSGRLGRRYRAKVSRTNQGQ